MTLSEERLREMPAELEKEAAALSVEGERRGADDAEMFDGIAMLLVKASVVIKSILRSDAHTSGEVVKALEWQRGSGNALYSYIWNERYSVHKHKGKYTLLINSLRQPEEYETEEDGIAAAQADFETRIRSALSPGHPIQGEAYEPALIEYEGEGEPYVEYIEADVPTVTRTGFAGELMMSMDRSRIVGMRVYTLPPVIASQPPTPAGVREITEEEVERACTAYDHTDPKAEFASRIAIRAALAAAKGAGEC